MLNWQKISEWLILLVDDEADNLEVIAESLMFHGFKVKTASNGNDALTVLETFTPTLILTDLSMPRMDGWQLRTHVRALPQMVEVPIVALTAHAMVGDMERALEVGFDGYMTKPINVPTLVQDLRKALVKLENPNAVVGKPLNSQPLSAQTQSTAAARRTTTTTAAVVVPPDAERTVKLGPLLAKTRTQNLPKVDPAATVALPTVTPAPVAEPKPVEVPVKVEPTAAVAQTSATPAPGAETRPVEAAPAKSEPVVVVAQSSSPAAPLNEAKAEQ